jgi:hypothetical protein
MRRKDNMLLVLTAISIFLIAVIYSCSNPKDPVDSQPPTVTITNPANNSRVPNTVDVTAEASDNQGVVKVEFYIDNQLYYTDEVGPWGCLWTTTMDESGEHTIFARAFDVTGNLDNSELVTVHCENTPPGTVSDLAATAPDISGSLTLTWTAPGDNGTTGTACTYDLRRSCSPITNENWAAASQLDGEPDPQEAGSAESCDVEGLGLSNTYCFALRTCDTAGNWSDVSNNVEVVTMDLFGNATTISVGDLPTAITCGDFDGDLDIDIAVAHASDTENVSILLNQGDGSFDPAVLYTGYHNISGITVFDSDDDSDLDLAISNYVSDYEVLYIDTVLTGFIEDEFGNVIDTTWRHDSSYVNVSPVSVMVNDGAGTFEALLQSQEDTLYMQCLGYSFIGGLHCVWYDTGVWSYEPSIFHQYLGPVDSIMLDTSWFRSFADSVATFVWAGDLDGDGLDDDLGVSNLSSSNISALINNGDGTFPYPINLETNRTDARGICVADLNNDGLDDLANTNGGNDQLTVYINNGDGTFITRILEVGDEPYAIYPADVDGDGDIDLVSTDARAHTLTVSFNEGDGQFVLRETCYSGHRPVALTVNDFDGDDAPEVCVVNAEDNTISLLMNDRLGTALYYSANTVEYDVGSSPNAICAGDFDGDGFLDIAVVNGQSNDVTMWFNQRVE